MRALPKHALPGILLTRESRGRAFTVWLAVLALVGTVIAYSRGAVVGTAHAAVPPPVWSNDSSVVVGPAAYLQSDSQLSPTPAAPGSSSSAATSSPSSSASASSLAADGIPSTALAAYQSAAAHVTCGLPWQLLAGIGRVESDHGRFAGAVLHVDGLSTPPVIGIALDGTRSAVIRDTDHGRYDHDTVYDRAVGPMQFIPSTWQTWGVDGNGDGVADPFNIFDAAAAAADYLCSAGGDLATSAGQQRAVYAYNHSDAYVSLVLQTEAIYAGTAPVVIPAAPTGPVHLPPVDPGPPRGLTSHTGPSESGSPVTTSPSVAVPESSGPASSSASASPPLPTATPCPDPSAVMCTTSGTSDSSSGSTAESGTGSGSGSDVGSGAGSSGGSSTDSADGPSDQPSPTPEPTP